MSSIPAPKKVNKFEFTEAHATQSKYDWDQLFDGNTYELVHGVHFTSDPQNFRMMAQNQGDRKHVNVQTQLIRGKAEGETDKVYIKGTPMTDTEAAEADARIEAKKDAEKARRADKKAKAEAEATAAA